jgi:hypothetical protein
MTSVPRKFQQATVAVAVASITGAGSRRFLVADEVGLGKTTVAREVVRRLSADGTKPLTVYYITSNTRVSDQNASRLVDFLTDQKAKKAALSKVDRLSMIPLDPKSDSPLRLYSLAPLTSFPPETARPNPGSALERAFLSLLLEKVVPGILDALPNGFMQQRAVKSWLGACATAKRLIGNTDRKLVSAYRDALRERFGHGLKRKIAEAAASQSPSRTLTTLRRLLAEACLAGTPPNLIIFDEFQRFRELLAPAASDRLGRALLGIGRRKPAMLLLSATPYRLYGESWNGKDGPRAHEELFETIEFLTGSKDVRDHAEDLFASFGEILRAIGDADGETIDPVLQQRAEETRNRIDELLRPHIARTERPPATGSARSTQRDPLSIEATDLRMFKHFASPISGRNRTVASTYWLSVPLPAQALGARYKIAVGIEFDRTAGLPHLRPVRRPGEGKGGWGSPKLRALQQINPASELALPWVAPSIAWWPLAGPWAAAPTQKTLLFSRFRATPQSVAALMSLGVEDTYLDARPGARRRVWESKRLQPQSGLPVMALFHPSPFLIRETDPLKGTHANQAQALRTVSRQLRMALRALTIEVRSKPKKDAMRARPVWNLLAAIERMSGDFDACQTAWEDTAGDEAVLGRIVEERSEIEDVDWISATELGRLAEMALAGPAIVVGRALRRHFPAAVDEEHLHRLAWFCWHRLRPYLDNKVFWGRLGDGKPTEVLQAAVREGGLESVLDEHFWLAIGQTDRAQLLEELGSALHASLGWFTFKALPTSATPIRLRCHAAVPFSGTESNDNENAERALADQGEEPPPRSEGLRRAFNTPFWPHILATTSIGQEGLDFHSWCRRIVHWDLPSNPVDLEQREGRISRYGGLLVRRPLGDAVRENALTAAASGRSPWTEVAVIAEGEHRDGIGLSPWWTLEGAEISRHVLALSKSRDFARFDHLQRQRLLYRLALGQPNQEDLINHLARGSDQKIVELSALALDLRPRSENHDVDRSPNEQRRPK